MTLIREPRIPRRLNSLKRGDFSLEPPDFLAELGQLLACSPPFADLDLQRIELLRLGFNLLLPRTHQEVPDASDDCRATIAPRDAPIYQGLPSRPV
jgi:hypothetical protein